MDAINVGITTIQKVYNGQEAVIIHCSDVGLLLKSELLWLGLDVCLGDAAIAAIALLRLH